MTPPQAPLSPFLHYRPQLTSVLSITHRITGVFLSLGAVLLSVWLATLAVGAEAYHGLNERLAAWYGQGLLACMLFSLYYHLCNGVRHLFWDLGLGLELKTAYRSGYAVVIASVLLTAATAWVRQLP